MTNFPKKKYKIIYADPPWTFTFWSEKAQRKVSNHYQLMTANEIYNLPVSKISEENCILFLWVTYPNLLEGLETIKRWGFTYKTCGFSWIKKNKIKDSLFWGMGYYTRSNNEICLLATKGKPKRISSKVHQVVIDKIREHSRKPDCIRDRIVELCGDVSRIELFARQDFTHKGWDHWGNELNE
tara:strand:- start:1811 stop:2359 length:549 start_codon:yes stop_codon:yes gene_type:complete